MIVLEYSGYGSLPRANHSAPVSDMRLDAGNNLLCGPETALSYCTDNALPLLETVAEDQEICNKHRSQGNCASNLCAGILENDFLRSTNYACYITCYGFSIC